MNYAEIKYCDIANGVGVRTTLFVSGCRNHCPECFQPQTWDFGFGKAFTREVEDEIIKSLEPAYVTGLTLLGGEPMEPENQEALLPFLRKVKAEFPDKDIWLYTGNRLEEVASSPLLSNVDVVVDGPFLETEKDAGLAFRGSRNQRIIDLKTRSILSVGG